MTDPACTTIHPSGAPCHLPAHDEASGHRSDIGGQRLRWWWPDCIYCQDTGMVPVADGVSRVICTMCQEPS